MNDLVSIILPIYNGEKYMKESIESVINQTYQNWELLILDDCSSDATSTIANEYIVKDNRIKYYKNENNLRLPKNLNKGFSLSKGYYLTWTSDDNIYKNDAIEKNGKKINESGKKFVYASCRIIDSNGKEIEYIMANKNGNKSIVGSNPVGACFMYTRDVYELVGEYDPEYVLVEDFDYWQRIASKFEFTYISEILYYYRFHEGALTSTMRKDNFYKSLKKVLLKNRLLFGKLDLDQKYYFYKGLNECNKNLNQNEKVIQYNIYAVIFFFRRQLPYRINRLIK